MPLDIAALIAEERRTRLIILRSPDRGTFRPDNSKLVKQSETKRRYYKPPPILTDTEAAEILDLDVETVRELAVGGALKPHNRLSQDEQKRDTYYFSCYTVEKYKNRSINHTGLVIFANAAKMLSLWPDNFYKKYVKTGRLEPALDEGRRGDYYFHLEDVYALIEIEKQTIITPETAEILGVNVSCVDKMIADGSLTPISGPKIDGFGKNLFLRRDIEELQAEREAFKTKRIKEGGTPRFGRQTPRARPVRNVIGPRIEQLLKKWHRQSPPQHISGYRLYRQLVDEGYQVGIASVYMCLRQRHQQVV
jgi:hypothetical protein